ncbi:MAG TPA: YggS family pyridoxal phosphate-dependent enzyme [Dehalococcoidia bacterium]|nr:YggS family pyridoxal phosphate-dependent enzyme [Dehalococcoidia bacterium]
MSAQEIAAAVADVRKRIALAAERSGRDGDAITVLAVTKTFPVETIVDVLAAGLHEVGENRVQEAIPKIEAIARWAERSGMTPPRWHLVGHLQRNKVRDALEHFAILQSLDSVRLAEALDQRAQRTLDVYLEVNVGGEESKQGFAPDDVSKVLAAVSRLPHLNPIGLMTVAPLAEDDVVRRVFRSLREIAQANGLKELSMGMSNDFEIAVEEGATCVRLGRVLFGQRSG